MKALFSSKLIAFIPENMAIDGSYSPDVTDNLIVVSHEELSTYWRQEPPVGKMLGAANGRPVWVDLPPPTKQEIIEAAEREKNSKIQNANNYMNNKQWPGKAAVGRLKGSDLANYNVWLDYLDALDAIDTTRARGIDWPTPPAYPAS